MVMVALESDPEKIWIAFALPLSWFFGEGEWEVYFQGWMSLIGFWLQHFWFCLFLRKGYKIKRIKRREREFLRRESLRKKEVNVKKNYNSPYIAWVGERSESKKREIFLKKHKIVVVHNR